MKQRTALRMVFRLAVVSGWLCSTQAQQAPESAASPPAMAQPQPSGDPLTVAAGGRLLLELESPLHTRTSHVGDRIYFHTMEEVWAGSEVAIPRDSRVQGTVTKVKRPGRIRGRAELRLRFDDIWFSDGAALPLRASVVRAGFVGAGESKDSEPGIKGEAGSGGNVAVIAQGGIQGAVVGGLARGAKAAGYGAAIGAAIGLGSVLLQRGPDLDLPRSTMFEARIDAPIQVPAAAARRATAQSARASVPQGAERNPGDFPPLAEGESEERGSVPRPVLRRNRGTPQEEPPLVLTTASAPDASATPTAQPQPNPLGEDAEGGAGGTGYKVSVGVQLVVVEAVVRDRGGRLMEGLKKGEFRVFENGAEQTVRDFSCDELPLAVALVVDRSGSVAPYMPELRESAYRALSQLKVGDEIALFAFASSAERLEDLTTDCQSVADRIADIRGGGGTNIVDALFDAVHYLGMVAPKRRRAVILISDNQPTVSPRASEAGTVRTALENETVVYSIKAPGERMPVAARLLNLVGGAGSVSKITQETGGEILDAAGLGGVGMALEEAMARLRLRYTLGYYPAAPFRDTSFRSIEVRLDKRFGKAGADYTIRARRGYYPPSAP